MRLNRVLLLAATISIMIFALVFTVSCSGDDGKAGRNGDICTVEPNGEAWDVYCNGDKFIGTLKNNDTGEPGAAGAAGAPGAQGADGSECHLSGLNIVCNGETKGSLESCASTIDPTNKQHITVTCGKSTIEICEGTLPWCANCSNRGYAEYGTKLFDPSKNSCSESGAIVLSKVYEGICPDKKTTYDKRKEYCGMGTGTDSTKYPKQTFCGANLGAKNKLNMVEATNSNGGDLDQVACRDSSFFWDGFVCWRNTNKGEYCRYSITNTDVSLNVNNIKLDTVAYPSTEVCDDGKKPNNGKYNREYCGFKQNENKTSLQKDACDDYFLGQVVNVGFSSVQGPNNGVAAPNRANAGTTKTILGYVDARNTRGAYTESYTFYYGSTGLRNGHYTKEVASNPITDWGSWTETYSYPAITAAKYNFGPHERGYNSTYCEVTSANKDKVPLKTVTSDNFCNYSDKSTSLNYRVAINKGTWQGQYCGFRDATNTSKVVYKDRCSQPDVAGGTVYTGPNEVGYKRGYCQAGRNGETRYTEDFCETGSGTNTTKQTINEKTWKSQYCGVNKNSVAARYSDICDDGKGPNSDSYNGGYCRFSKAGKSKYSTELCGDDSKPNDGAWGAEYCGYPDTLTTVTTLLKGACDDGDGPNSYAFGGGYCAAINPAFIKALDTLHKTEYSADFCGASASKVNENTWKSEYCGYADSTATTPIVQTGICDDGLGPNQERFGAGYCQGLELTGKTTLSAIKCDGVKFNEGAWKGEYCFTDNKIAACTGGRKANEEKMSTDPFSIRCEFLNTFLCSESNLIACDKDGCDHLNKNDNLVWDEAAYLCKERKIAPR